jgi:hypothetical protein
MGGRRELVCAVIPRAPTCRPRKPARWRWLWTTEEFGIPFAEVRCTTNSKRIQSLGPSASTSGRSYRMASRRPGVHQRVDEVPTGTTRSPEARVSRSAVKAAAARPLRRRMAWISRVAARHSDQRGRPHRGPDLTGSHGRVRPIHPRDADGTRIAVRIDVPAVTESTAMSARSMCRSRAGHPAFCAGDRGQQRPRGSASTC